MPDKYDMELDARPTVQEICVHENMEYQAFEADTNVGEDYYCLDCGKQFDVPEPDEDMLRGDR
jgi:hypothetical protein